MLIMEGLLITSFP